MNRFMQVSMLSVAFVGGLAVAAIPAIIASFFLEWGYSRWQNRSFCWKEWLTLLILAIGVRFTVK